MKGQGHSRIRAFITDPQGRVVIAQRPNLPLLGWLLLLAAAWLVEGPMQAVLEFFSAAFLFTWAYLEITRGDSPFRRVLGATVMTVLVVSRVWPAL